MVNPYFSVRRKRKTILRVTFYVIMWYIMIKCCVYFYNMNIVKPSVPLGKNHNIYECESRISVEGIGEKGSSCLSNLTLPLFSVYRMNISKFQTICSSLIALNRTLIDNRDEECKFWSYPHNLPSTSIVIVFYNEVLSILLRTIYSIYNRSPKSLEYEILLVDDCSDSDELKNLNEHLHNFGNIVKLLRNDKREGIIASRNNAANLSTGNIIIFLDSHCEVNENWIPPLLVPLMDEGYAATAPIEDSINFRNLKYQSTYLNAFYRGLDPTIVFYMGKNSSRDLDSSDAHFVDILHTGAGILGQWGPNGHADFYINGGSSQPGCASDTIFKTLACDHTKVTPYFIESIVSKKGFWAYPCPTLLSFMVGWCNPEQEEYVQMGEHITHKARGIYYVTTNPDPPYAQGYPGKRRRSLLERLQENTER